MLKVGGYSVRTQRLYVGLGLQLFNGLMELLGFTDCLASLLN